MNEYKNNLNIFKINEIDLILKPLECNKRKFKHHYYINAPVSFDIETTSAYVEDKKVAFMYSWAISLNGNVVLGRSREEFKTVLVKISDYYELDNDKRLVIYVHNLSYEFQFLKGQFNITEVFALDTRQVAKCFLIDYGIELRCSYILTNNRLEKVGEDLHKYKIEKLSGSVDYSLIRTSKTKLEEKDLLYLRNDVLVVTSLIAEEIERLGNINKIPLTKTGYVREYCRVKCLDERKNHHERRTSQNYIYNKLIHSMNIKSIKEYEQLKRAFQGGYTHANALNTGIIFKDVSSYDFTSSYPAVMCSELYPMSTGQVKEIKTLEEFNEYNKKYLSIFDITFINIESTLNECYLSLSRCIEVVNPFNNNGRISKADKLTITLTNIDFEIVQKAYKYDKIIIKNYRYYRKAYLPKIFIEAILKLYQDKTELKGVEEKEVDYMRSKEQLNSLYGMCVMDPARDVIEFNNVKGRSKKAPDIEKVLNEYNNSKTRFLFYVRGVFITAYARRNLWSGIFELKDDYIYSDTDSLKFVNAKNHLNYFENYNKAIRDKLITMCNFYNLDTYLIEPKTIKGEVKTLGVWDYEGQYQYFKTLGAKRYLTYKDNKLGLTISGVNKKNGQDYLLFKYKTVDNIFNNFNNGLEFPKEYKVKENNKWIIKSGTGKQTLTYIDNPCSGKIIDKDGLMQDFDENSFIHMEPASYDLSLTSEYLNYISLIKGVK